MAFDPIAQTYLLSPLFQEYAFDLKNWMMNERFFEKYKEMRYDIPSSGSWGSLNEFFDFYAYGCLETLGGRGVALKCELYVDGTRCNVRRVIVSKNASIQFRRLHVKCWKCVNHSH